LLLSVGTVPCEGKNRFARNPQQSAKTNRLQPWVVPSQVVSEAPPDAEVVLQVRDGHEVRQIGVPGGRSSGVWPRFGCCNGVPAHTGGFCTGPISVNVTI
jgi:hypothetical protein